MMNSSDSELSTYTQEGINTQWTGKLTYREPKRPWEAPKFLAMKAETCQPVPREQQPVQLSWGKSEYLDKRELAIWTMQTAMAVMTLTIIFMLALHFSIPR